MSNQEKGLSTIYFSKEFPPNWEVEWKADLATQDPFGFIARARDSLGDGTFYPFTEAKSMGNMPTGLGFHHLFFHYYGHQEDSKWIRDLVLVQPPGIPVFIPQIKITAPDVVGAADHHVVLRVEHKGSLAQRVPRVRLKEYLADFEEQAGNRLSFVGTIDRQRYSIFVTNTLSGRNYSLLADICHEPRLSLGVALSQIEVEYKGISGVSYPSRLAQKAVLEEFDILAAKLLSVYESGVIKPTSITKFDWLVKQLDL